MNGFTNFVSSLEETEVLFLNNAIVSLLLIHAIYDAASVSSFSIGFSFYLNHSETCPSPSESDSLLFAKFVCVGL